MCGICGIVDFNQKIPDDFIIKSMMESIKHRGPDGNGFYTDKNTSLGHVRLSIIDLAESANQPMFADNGNLVIVFNGEIYNYQEIKKELSGKYTFITQSDTEVILNSYKEWGEECLHKFNGMFSFVIYDKLRNTLFAARDRFGIKPFYYFYDGNSFIFGSEIKAIFSSKKVKPEINEKMLYDFIIYKFTDHSAETCFKKILHLRPGHKLAIDINSRTINISQWYFLPENDNVSFGFNDYKNKLSDHLNESVRLHLVSDVPVGLALSGGLDSSTIAALMRQQLPDNITLSSFSAVYDKSWAKDESAYIEALAEKINIKTNFVTPSSERLLSDLDKLIYHQEEPFGSASLFASWCVYSEAQRKGMKVLLNGQGSDELFCYDYMAAFYFNELFRKLKLLKLVKELYWFNKKQAYHTVFTFKLFVFLLMPRFIKNKSVGSLKPVIAKDFFNKYNNSSDFLHTMFNSGNLKQNVKNHLLFKLQHLLRIEDKNSMTFSVEGRVPFLEHKFVEFSYNIPAKYKVHSGEVKYILKQSVKDLLPEKISARNDKIGYETPMDQWFREPEFKMIIDEMINSDDQPMETYLNLSYIRNKWEQHKCNKGNNGQIIWNYLFLTRWYNIFFKKSDSPV